MTDGRRTTVSSVRPTHSSHKPSPTQGRKGNLVIAQVIGGLNVGGAERQLVHLVNELRAHDRLIIFLGHERPGPALYDHLDRDVRQIRSPIRKRSLPVGILALARTLAHYRCNVVHTHMFWANLYGAVAARLADVPVIVTTEHGENRWKTPYHRWLERNVISRVADMRFCVSRNILERRREVDGVPVSKLQIVANGTVLPATPTTLWGNEEPVIGSVGRFVKQKDFGLFVEIIAMLRRRGYGVRGCIVGDGPELQDIRRQVLSLDLESVIELPGFATDIGDWYRRFDIYAITSNEEGMPMSLIEAMSYGLPVVASDVGAISEVIRSGDDGTIVAAGNVSEFADVIAGYLDNRVLAEKMGCNARQRIVDEYSISAVAKNYESCYRQLLKGKAL